MGKPCSGDLRLRVAAAAVGGRTCRAVADLFGVSAASAAKWSQQLRATGSAAAKPMGDVRRDAPGVQRAWLLARIKEAPDLTLRALAAALAERGVAVSHWAVWKLLASEGTTSKESILPSEQDRPGAARRRLRWRRLQGQLNPKRLVFQAPGLYR